MKAEEYELPKLAPRSEWQGDAQALGSNIRRKIKGEVRFDDGSRALYATDASNYRQAPIGVVLPTCVEDVIDTVEQARQAGAPILSRGGGTSLAGQCCNHAVVMDMSKYFNQILEVNAARRMARVRPGLVLDRLRDAARKQGLTFGPDPATHDHCTLGGMLGNDSCGAHSVMAQFYGPGSRVADNVLEMEVLTYDGLRLKVGPTSEAELSQIIAAGGRRGEIYAGMKKIRDKYASLIRAKYPKIPRRVSGYNLDELLPERGFNVARALVGTEATCVTILEATLTLIDEPKARSLLVLGYPTVYDAGEHVMDILPHKPIALEGLDDLLICFNREKGTNTKYLHMLPKGKGWLVVEFGGDSKEESDAKARKVMEALRATKNPPDMRLYDDKNHEKELWEIRESGLGATAFVPGEEDAWEGWEDSAVPPEKVGSYLRDLRDLFEKYHYKSTTYGHFGQGCIHCRINFNLYSADGIKDFRRFLDEAADLVVSYGGSISGEHGDGQSKAELLPKMFGPELIGAFREFKALWDPQNKMNPGKIVDPYPITSNLRLGPEYRPWEPDTYFQFPDDRGSLARGALRCVGVGKCRKTEEGTMCPSYMVTKEEEHSTRGRAHMLFEMLNGDLIKDGWRDKNVLKSLDLCLSCKGCKGECPLNVDIATYKAEFLAHYYKGRLRPRAAYAMGLIHRWAKLAALMPRVANFFTQTQPFAGLMKWMGGIAPQRKMPQFAGQTFRAWFEKREPRNHDKPEVILWADTFNNHFFPDVLKAAVEVLEAAGFQVIVPRKQLCCGRPLYDYGMLDTAIKLLKEVLQDLRPYIQKDTPFVGLEPSCTAVFRDELLNLFPNDLDAARLRGHFFTLGEFLEKKAPGFAMPQLNRQAILHGHCHQKAIMGIDYDASILKKAGVTSDVINSGCCGMAGSFGFEKDKYEVSVKVGEHCLLPAVREAEEETLIVADGFSCREQVSQLTNRHPLHTAEVLRMALHNGAVGKPKVERMKSEPSSSASATVAGR